MKNNICYFVITFLIGSYNSYSDEKSEMRERVPYCFKGNQVICEMPKKKERELTKAYFEVKKLIKKIRTGTKDSQKSFNKSVKSDYVKIKKILLNLDKNVKKQANYYLKASDKMNKDEAIFFNRLEKKADYIVAELNKIEKKYNWRKTSKKIFENLTYLKNKINLQHKKNMKSIYGFAGSVKNKLSGIHNKNKKALYDASQKIKERHAKNKKALYDAYGNVKEKAVKQHNKNKEAIRGAARKTNDFLL